MDKKQQLSDKKKSAVLRIQRTEAYAERVRLLFAKTVNDILALNKSMPKLEEGVMYSFDGTNDKMQKDVEMLLRRLASTVTTAIRNGVNLEWEEANVECDKFIASLFGKKVLSSPEFSAWVDRNTSARDAFTNRADKGLRLSDRVWKSVKQLREEMEVAMTVAIGEGDSASSMSRKVREYLNDPELMFRRFRYKAGEKEVVDKDTGEITKVPVYGRKWEKRVKDEATGKYKWIDYDRDSYKTGAGVYKSSAKNAMRVARTETNMAYRQADHQRWQNMEFVLGQHIELSRNHPKRDICDDLEGDYPKDFVFDGWHPQCFCVCTPILVDWEEQRKVFRAKLKGETYTPKGKRITECPDNFKSWVNDNKEKIHVVRKSGKEPYFIKNNAAKIDGIINPQLKALTPIEIAKKRHDARTPEQVDAIRRRVRYRAKSIRAAETYIRDFKDYPDSHYSALKSAYKRADWEAVRKEALVLARRKRTITSLGVKLIKDAEKNADIDISRLQEAIKNGNIKQIQEERQKIDSLISQGVVKDAGIHPAVKKQYSTNEEINETFRQINAGLSEKWFEHGDLVLTVETDRANNGSTTLDGRIKLQKIRLEGVMSALSKIGQERSQDITISEADALATLWHEITHNRNKTTWVGGKFQHAIFCKTKLQRSFMELANEFVARKTLPEFYNTLGCKEVPHPEFIKDRSSTNYNDMVTNYDWVVSRLGLDEQKVLDAVRSHLYDKPYNSQIDGLVEGLMRGGIKGKGGKPLKERLVKSLVIQIREGKTGVIYTPTGYKVMTKEEKLEKWMADNHII